MARTSASILFRFRATTRDAKRAFRQMERGLKDMRRGYREARVAGKRLGRENKSLWTTFRWGARSAKNLGMGFLRLASGPALMLVSALRSVGGMAMGVVRHLKRMAFVTVGVTVAAMTKAVSSFAGFERQMIRVRAIMGGSEGDWRRTEGTIRKVILTSEFMPKAIGEAAQNLAALGVNSAEAFEKMLPAARRFATVLGVDINEGARLLKATMNQFGLEVDDADDVVTVFANAWANSAANAQKLGDSLKYVGFTASANNQSLRDVVSVIEALVDRGLEASMAGTALRNVFLTLQNPTDDGKKALKEMGVSLEEVKISSHGLLEVLGRLADAEMTAEQAGRIFNMRGLDAARVLAMVLREAKGAGKSILEYRDELDETGRVMDMINQLNSATAQQWDILKGSVSGATQQIGRLIARGIGLGETFGGMSAAVNEFSETLAAVDTKEIQAVFSTAWDDITSGRVTNIIVAWAKGLPDVLAPIFEYLGVILGVALVKAFEWSFESSLKNISAVSMWALNKAGLVSDKDVKNAREDAEELFSGRWVDWPGFGDDRSGRVRAGAEKQWRAMRDAGAELKTPGAFRDAAASGERELIARRAVEAAMRHPLMQETGGGRLAWAPAAVHQDNRLQNFYNVPSERAGMRSRAIRRDPGTGK